MSITDKLRKYAAGYRNSYDAWSGIGEDLDYIADRIDAEHEGACAEAYGNGVMSVPIAIDESQWVKLPVDADGVPIHVGDKMEFCAFDIEHPVIRTVDGIGKDVFFAWCGERGYQQHDAKRYRHYTPPTVEDVLRELADDIAAVLGGDDFKLDGSDELFAEYAAKLRLKEDV